MKRLLLIVLPLLMIVGCSEVEGQQLISDITERYRNGNIKNITYYKKTQNRIELVNRELYYENGQKKEEITYKNLKEIERLKWTYYKNGQKRSEGTYNYEELISEKVWNEDGSVRK